MSSSPEEFDLPIGGFAAGAPGGIGDSAFEDVPEQEILEIGGEPGSDPALEFRRTLGMFATGVTVITTHARGQVHGMTANAFMSVSLKPPLVLISVDRRARMNQLLREGVRFGISVLESRQWALSDRFAGRVTDAPEPAFEIVHETPLVEDALAHLVARVVRSYWGGDHSLFLGQVEYVRLGEGEPLLFHGGRYERLVRGHQSVFSALPRELLDPLLEAGTERTFADGEFLMERGEPGVTLYLILEGVARVERPGRIVRLGVGELVGEIEILDPGGGRIADVIAEGTVRAIAVAQDDVRAALESNPAAAWTLLGVLASRFRESA